MIKKHISLIPFLIITIIIISCRNDNFASTHYHAKLLRIEYNIPYFQSDSFINSPLGFELKPKIFENNYPGYFKKDTEISQNIQDKNIKDTLINFIHKNSIIQFYNASGKFMISAFDTDSPVIAIAGDLHIGDSKNNFTSTFGIKSLTYDTCDIGNMEGTCKFRFIFAKTKLIHIIYIGYMD
jgi:hypothetical protein